MIRFIGRGGYIGGITYSYGSSSGGGGFNESLSVHDDEYSLYLKPLGLNISRSDHNQQLSLEGAAESFWEMFIRRLQQ